MRKVWYHVGQVVTFTGTRRTEEVAVEAAERALHGAPDSRDRHRTLALALARAGRLERAEEVAEAWLERDRLDAEALATLADVVGRQGRRDESLRLLSGIVDLAPDDVTLQERLARAYERAARLDRACAHRLALAEIRASDTRALGAAVRCQRALGRAAGATRTLELAADPALRLRVEQPASIPPAGEAVRGAIVLDARWSGAIDLDLSIVTPQGVRLSWMGGRAGVGAASAAVGGEERLALRSAGRGSWLVEIARTRPGDSTPVSGNVRLRVHGQERTLPFRLESDHTVVARLEITRQFRLEELGR
jgi:hypothetical protein